MADQKKEAKAMLGQDQGEADRRRSASIDLPKPTPDQEQYLDEVKRCLQGYDASVIVGGPKAGSR